MRVYYRYLANTNLLQVMFLIAANPAPSFNDPTKFSPQFNEFIRACLQKNPQRRAAASDLLRVTELSWNFLNYPQCDFITKSKPPSESMIDLVGKATTLIRLSGGLEAALKARIAAPPPSKVIGEVNIIYF